MAKGGACVVKGGGVHEHHWMSLAGGMAVATAQTRPSNGVLVAGLGWLPDGEKDQ